MPEQPIVINDFRPGISQIVSSRHPLGTARDTDTYRCRASSTGALIPGARKLYTYNLTPQVDGGDNLAEQIRIIGLHCNDVIFWPGETTPGVDQNNSEIFVAFEYWKTVDGQNRQYFNVQKYRRHWRHNPGWVDIWSDYDVHANFDPEVRPKNCDFAVQRSNSANSNAAGPLILGWVVNGYARSYPDDTTPTIDSVRYMPGDKKLDPNNVGGLVSPHNLIAHQLRMVIFPLTLVGFGANAISTTNESFYWTFANDATQIPNTYLDFLASGENPVGYGSIASISADEFLLIKHRGGAHRIRGSLDDPTIDTFPNVRSTGMSMCYGTNSPKGWLYPVDGGGVWAYQGGDESIHITPNMEGDFWRPSLPNPEPAWGHQWSKCAQLNEYALFPGNWMLDTDTPTELNPYGGWWRIDDPADFEAHRWSIDWRGRKAYATPAGFVDGSDVVFAEYDITEKASDYSWRSHPIPNTTDPDKQIVVERVLATIIGKGIVDVYLKTAQMQRWAKSTFHHSDDYDPFMTSSPVDAPVQGSHLEVKIVARALDDDSPAPTIDEIVIIPHTGNPIPRR